MTCKECFYFNVCYTRIMGVLRHIPETYDLCKFKSNYKCEKFLESKKVVVLPCNTGDIIKDGAGESYIVDEIRYIKLFLFDGSEKEIKKVSLRDKGAKPPIYSTTIHSFEEIENILKPQKKTMQPPSPFADLVEVVRCKNCAIPHNKFTGCPYLNGLVPPENHFCGYGKRKEAATHGDPIPAEASGEI